MIGRVILAALLAGVAAGLIMGVIQHFKLTPLILEAEVFETAGGAGHSHETTTAAEPAAAEACRSPKNGVRRTAGSARSTPPLPACWPVPVLRPSSPASRC